MATPRPSSVRWSSTCPRQVSSSAARLLQAIAAHAPVTVIVAVTGRADAPVPRLLERLDLDAAPLSPPGAAATTTAPTTAEPSVELVVAADEDDEVRTALRRVVAAAEAGIALERIAIVHAPRAPYGRLLTEHLTAARLPWNGITASSVAERVAGRTLLGLLDLDTAAFRRRDVFALLASVPPSRRRPVAAWERQARRARVVAGRPQWDERLAARAADERRQADAGGDAQAWRYEEAERTDELRAFIAALAERLEPPGQPTWAAHARWAGRCWSSSSAARRSRRGGVPRSSAPRSAWSGCSTASPVSTAWRTTSRATASIGPCSAPRSTPSWRMARPRSGGWARGSSSARSRWPSGIDADLVIVLGLVEGGLPGGLGDDPLLSDRTRRTLDGALTTAAERRERLHHQLLAVAGAAERTVVASRPLADLRTGSARYASRWLSGLERSAPARTVRHTSFHQGLHDGLPPATEQEAGLTDLQRIRSTGHPLDAHPLAHGDQALHRALTLIDARASDELTAYDGNLASLAAEGVDLSPHQPVAPTALEAWVRCPFSYFVRHVLGVRELEALQEELSLRPADRGVLVHAVLESVVGELIRAGDVPEPDQPWSISAAARLVAALEARCEATEAEGEVGPALHWQLEQRRLRRRLDGFVELDLAARAEHGVRPVATELQFGTDRPFALTLPGGRTLALHGVIDRVDAGPDRLAVIDYKTGRARSSQTDPFIGRDPRSSCPSTPSPHATCSSGRTSRWWPSTGTSRTATTSASASPSTSTRGPWPGWPRSWPPSSTASAPGCSSPTRTSRTPGGEPAARTATLTARTPPRCGGSGSTSAGTPRSAATGAWSTTWRTTRPSPATPESHHERARVPSGQERRTQRANGPSGRERRSMSERSERMARAAESGDRSEPGSRAAKSGGHSERMARAAESGDR